MLGWAESRRGINKFFRVSLLSALTLAILFSLVSTSAFATKQETNEIGLPKEIPRIVFTRWPNSSRMARQTFLREVNGRFEPYFSWDQVLHRMAFCESLLAGAQLFPLGVMLADAYISEAQRAELLRLGERLDPAQFHFADLIRVEEGANLEGRDFNLERGDMPMSLIPLLHSHAVPLTQATLWTVAGQTSSPQARVALHAMPWQLDQEFANVALDRSRYPLVWEIGRAAQSQAGSVDILFRAHAASMLGEVLAMGRNLDEAYVFIHTLGAPQSRLTGMRRHPVTGEPVFRLFAQHGTGMENVVFVAKLADLLATMPPDTFSQRVHQVIEASGQRLNWFGAMEHLVTLRGAMREDLEFVHPWNREGQNRPIILRNTTPIVGWFMAEVARRYGIFEQGGPEVAAALSQVRWLDNNLRGPEIVDEFTVSTMEIARQKLFSISNLDPAIARAHPDYVRLVLMASYLHYERRVRRSYPREADAILMQTRFVINSGDDTVILQARGIRGGVAEQFPWQYLSARVNTGDHGIHTQPHYNFGSGPGYIFSGPAIRSLLQENPFLARQARSALRPGGFQLRQMINVTY